MIFQPWTASLGALPKFHLPSNVEETTPWGMSLETLMEEARKLGEQERRRLAVFLTTLRGGEPSFADEMAHRIDDKTSGHWVTLEELNKRYAADA